jgi:hypothetical protein
VVRFLPSLAGYLYAHDGTNIYVNLYVGSQATIDLPTGAIAITQTTNYPWDGKITLTVTPSTQQSFTLFLRIPGWARQEPVPSDLYHYLDTHDTTPTLTVNGTPVAIELERGYARITRLWQAGDQVQLELPMPMRRVGSHPKLATNAGRVAVERGPVLYCVEETDNEGYNGGNWESYALPDSAELHPAWEGDLLGGCLTLTAATPDGALKLIPYHLWGHRELGQMAVWLRRT